jgi:hypothetical protein
MPALSLIFGHHIRTLRHVINATKQKEKEPLPKTTTSLKKLRKALSVYGAELPRDIKEALRSFEDAIEEAMAKRGLL